MTDCTTYVTRSEREGYVPDGISAGEPVRSFSIFLAHPVLLFGEAGAAGAQIHVEFERSRTRATVLDDGSRRVEWFGEMEESQVHEIYESNEEVCDQLTAWADGCDEDSLSSYRQWFTTTHLDAVLEDIACLRELGPEPDPDYLAYRLGRLRDEVAVANIVEAVLAFPADSDSRLLAEGFAREGQMTAAQITSNVRATLR